jgi:hypothetical protein
MFYLILMANNDISSKEIKSKNLFMIKISGYILSNNIGIRNDTVWTFFVDGSAITRIWCPLSQIIKGKVFCKTIEDIRKLKFWIVFWTELENGLAALKSLSII